MKNIKKTTSGFKMVPTFNVEIMEGLIDARNHEDFVWFGTPEGFKDYSFSTSYEFFPHDKYRGDNRNYNFVFKWTQGNTIMTITVIDGIPTKVTTDAGEAESHYNHYKEGQELEYLNKKGETKIIIIRDSHHTVDKNGNHLIHCSYKHHPEPREIFINSINPKNIK